VTDFLRWLTHTHTMRWHAAHKTVGAGHLYQGRFKTFPVERGEHLLSRVRFVERNPLRAKLVERAEDWRWSSLHRRHNGLEPISRLSPLILPANWVQRVNRAETKAELEAVRLSIVRSQPFGSNEWKAKTAKKLGLQSTMRPPGRPKKEGQD
jgi:putative transposase